MTGLTTDESAHHLLQREVETHLSFFKRRQEIEARYVHDLREVRRLSLEWPIARSGTRGTSSRSLSELTAHKVIVDHIRFAHRLGHKQLALKEVHTDDKDRLAALVPEAWRRAAQLIRDNTLLESQTHAASAEGLSKMVKNLSDFRDNKATRSSAAAGAKLEWGTAPTSSPTSERSRRRIRDELKDNAHADYKVTVARLRKTYERKVEEVQAHESEERERERHEQHQLSLTHIPSYDHVPAQSEHWAAGAEPSASSSNVHAHGGPKTRERADSSTSNRASHENVLGDPSSTSHTVVGSPPGPSASPVFVSGAGSSHAASAYRDPPSSSKGGNVFEQITKRDWSGEKHRINSLARAVGNLAKGNDAGGGNNGGLTSKSGSVRGQKARQISTKLKREAEQADRDYRDGVFRLETLRLHRMRLQMSAQQFLKEYAIEYSATLRDICTSVPAIARLLRSGRDGADTPPPGALVIEPIADGEKFAMVLRAPVPDPPVYYVNYFVGECRSLLFGVSLTDYHSTNPTRLVPLIVQKCIEAVDHSGLQIEGIYRISGKVATVQQIIHEIERDEESFAFRPSDDPAMIGGVLKLYLRQLPLRLFPVTAADRSTYSADFIKDPDACILALARRIRRLGLPHQATLKALCEHLARVVNFESVNKMTASNLGTIFAPVVFGEEEAATLEAAKRNDHMMDILILNHVRIFDGLPAESGKPRSRGASLSSGSAPPPPPSMHAASEQLAHLSVNERHEDEHSMERVIPTSASQGEFGTLGIVRLFAFSCRHRDNYPTAMENGGSYDSVFRLYQDNTISLLPHGRPRSSQATSSPLARHHFETVHPPILLPTSPTRNITAPSPSMDSVDQVALSSSSVNDLSAPSPPLSAALGRHVPVPDEDPQRV
ncbi:BZ3500_MvSof-1268-A1-R1_Chr5-2g07985 [Microbotryum saponariae]|uniref:BZ3500_MvSof-1268-A1-R1_Chr5-2g07985 protein n=1 Tax=Microbotryum saponariae TaxID=289078 RepID=A0A2X0LFR7_9BASI|nr:BZ3500_MvSof-1268-A1-R1_Chr5-2g07985 [Microbotryum saponariae]SDA05854.1 BZ3501_MvSof-1269-A2-R1_Chr5-2g07807 [Microbotryum saponariae]